MTAQGISQLCSLVGKTALVTGGSRGIGEATATQLARLGAQVWVVARDSERLELRRRQWLADGDSVDCIVADLSDPVQCASLPDKLPLDALDILINNVGSNIRKPTLEYAREEVELIMRTNLYSAFEVSRILHPLLAQQGGSIVNVSSVAGLNHIGTGVPYAMSKAALQQLTRNLAVEWATDNIRVNAVAPWYTDTPLARQVLKNPDYQTAVLARTPLGRIARAAEVASAIAFLASPAASFITGQCLAVDGGFSILGFTPP